MVGVGRCREASARMRCGGRRTVRVSPVPAARMASNATRHLLSSWKVATRPARTSGAVLPSMRMNRIFFLQMSSHGC